MYINTLTITSKGQISLPKRIRQILDSNIVSLVVTEDNKVMISPVHDLGGALSKYKKDSNLTFHNIREQVWLDSAKRNLMDI